MERESGLATLDLATLLPKTADFCGVQCRQRRGDRPKNGSFAWRHSGDRGFSFVAKITLFGDTPATLRRQKESAVLRQFPNIAGFTVPANRLTMLDHFPCDHRLQDRVLLGLIEPPEETR